MPVSRLSSRTSLASLAEAVEIAAPPGRVGHALQPRGTRRIRLLALCAILSFPAFFYTSFQSSMDHTFLSQTIIFRYSETLSSDEAQTISQNDFLQKKAVLYPIETLPQEGLDACFHATGIPKIALLFLTQGKLYHEPTWRQWFASASGVLPAEAFLSMKKKEHEHLATACSPSSSSQKEPKYLSHQFLFSVYVHAPPRVDTQQLGSFFSSFPIQHRLTPEWGSPLLIAATRNLLWEAFRDPLNQRFILLSEADVPLWHPLVFYRQVTGEHLSRTKARPPPPGAENDVEPWRYTWSMADHAGNVTLQYWRKSSQWFSLIREHVEVVLQDDAVFRAFEEHCRSSWDEEHGRWRDCYADEHYIPTLLAIKERGNETFEGVSGASFANWSEGLAHPKEYLAHEVTVESFKFLAGGSEQTCRVQDLDPAALTARILKGFVKIKDVLKTEHILNRIETRNLSIFSPPPLPPLNATCYLLARKFNASTVEAVLDNVFLQCRRDLPLLDHDVCINAAAERVKHRD